MGAVTIPCTSPRSASSTARTIAPPARRPAFAMDCRGAHVPVSSSACAHVPAGPTITSSAAPLTRSFPRRAATISVPMPRGSPSVTASRGRMRLGYDGFGRRPIGDRHRVEIHGDVRLAAKPIQEPAQRALLLKLLTDLVPELRQRVLAALVRALDARHDELAHVGDLRGDGEHDDVSRLLAVKR